MMILMLCGSWLFSQEDQPVAPINIPSQNLLKFNRFLINPTFSTVQEDKSYLNLYHRNQWVKFDDNYQTFLASYSGRIGDRSGLGLSIYHQKFATISNFGVMANYAYGVKLSDLSNLTFGFNLSYYDSGVDQSGLSSAQPNDPVLMELNGSSMLSFQPGFNLSVGSFDVGIYAENLFDYNLKAGESLTSFSEKTFTGHLMYTKRFKNTNGIMEQGKLSALSRVRRVGEEDINLSGSLILDLPKVGWAQAGYDEFYGVSAGLGFNLNKRISIGYTIEKGLKDQISNFGVTHEVHFAYSFQPNLTEDMVLKDIEEDGMIVELDEEAQDSINKLQEEIAENQRRREEMMFRQDSINEAKQREVNKRFAYLLHYVKDINDPEKAREVRDEIMKMKNDLDNGLAFDEDKFDNIRERALRAAMESQQEEHQKNTKKYNTRVAANTTTGSTSAKRQDSYSLSTGNYVAGMPTGSYVIANVYKGDYYTQKFLDKLKGDGIDAGVFEANGLKYVYIDKYDSKSAAYDAKAHDYNGTYSGSTWVYNITNDDIPASVQPSNTAIASADNAAKDSEDNYTEDNNEIANSDKSASNTTIGKGSGLINTSYEEYLQRNKAGISQCTERYIASLMAPYRKALPQEELLADASLDETTTVEKDPNGYYIVANVYTDMTYAQKFVDSLDKQGIKAEIYINPVNNYKYVYLEKYKTWKKAMSSYRSGIREKYKNDIWIMPVGSS
ncbi:PorP/SprF family type IX secretion system membrane protein [Robertkochia solimangrovi]|uniref:PorP/SprF family type IX secretion system membrane protein n=1 Tax=Robertkochia solimangrovi TaxID=2213046 RepID=UPI001F553A2C|nr:PorP/SprF family type IX secretion system membrane protein [Robertkochia solimangrovi]